jgi:hypothetical protein
MPTWMGLGSSRNDLNSLIPNWCTGGCWFTSALPMEDLMAVNFRSYFPLLSTKVYVVWQCSCG